MCDFVMRGFSSNILQTTDHFKDQNCSSIQKYRLKTLQESQSIAVIQKNKNKVCNSVI